MAKGSGFLGSLQKLGKALMMPVAVLPALAILLRLGAGDMLNIPVIAAAGAAAFDHLPILFAVGIGFGLADNSHGAAGLAGLIGYYVLTGVVTAINPDNNMATFGGIIAGVMGGLLYNKFKDTKLPDFLGFFGGKRFVPIITAFCALVLGVILGFAWPVIQDGIDAFGNAMASMGAFGSGLFGFFNRLLIPVGLHHVLNSIFWFNLGSFTDAAGAVATGDIFRFLAGDPTAGLYQAGFFPIFMFGLPGAALAMYQMAKPNRRPEIAGIMISVALTSFLTGITEPIEFLFMFLSPVLYGIHALLTGVSMIVCGLLGAYNGFGFSAGAIDFFLNWGIATQPVILLVVGVVFFVIYYLVFIFAIKQFNLATPGREDDADVPAIDVDASKKSAAKPASNKASKALDYIAAMGGKDNIINIEACITRIRGSVKDDSKLNEAKLKQLGATGVMKMGGGAIQIVVGTIADNLVSDMHRNL